MGDPEPLRVGLALVTRHRRILGHVPQLVGNHHAEHVAAQRTATADDAIHQSWWSLNGGARSRATAVEMRGFGTPVEVARFSGVDGGGQAPRGHSLTGLTVATSGLLFVCFHQVKEGDIIGHGLAQIATPTGWTLLDTGLTPGGFAPVSWTGYKRVTAGTHAVDVVSSITVFDTFPGNLTDWAAYVVFVPDSVDGCLPTAP